MESGKWKKNTDIWHFYSSNKEKVQMMNSQGLIFNSMSLMPTHMTHIDRAPHILNTCNVVKMVQIWFLAVLQDSPELKIIFLIFYNLSDLQFMFNCRLYPMRSRDVSKKTGMAFFHPLRSGESSDQQLRWCAEPGRTSWEAPFTLSHINCLIQNRKTTAFLSINSMETLKMAAGGAIEETLLATAVSSSVKHQKKPLKEGGGDLDAKESSAGWRGSKLTFISTVSHTPHSVSVARYFNSPSAAQNVHPGVSSMLIKSGFYNKWSCLTDVNRLCQNDVAKQPCWSAE